MRQITDLTAMQTAGLAILRAEKKHGFVPTMGNLHAGHRSLIEAARAECEIVTVSIFINPTQFNDPVDLDKYPRTLAADLQMCAEIGVDHVFIPTALDLYFPDRDIFVVPDKLAEHLCGISRGRGHFIGVSTIVAKLFNLVQPTVAYFGQKDVQQAIIVQRLIRDLNFPVKIALLPTVRAEDGLALSSRNRLLTPEQREIAPCLFAALKVGAEIIGAGEQNALLVVDKMTQVIGAHPAVEIDYLEVVDTETLDNVEIIRDLVLIVGAINLGEVRLIDNVLAKRGAESKD